MMADVEDIRLGIYRHYKGPLYQVLGLAHDANADTLASSESAEFELNPGDWPGVLGERIVVVYLPLQLDGAHLGPRMATRTLEDFLLPVCWDKDCHRFGQSPVRQCSRDWDAVKPRFDYLGSVLTESMISGKDV